MKIALGTAQFGLDYGISNADGRTSGDEVLRILRHAARAGVDVLDTAPAYGDAQQVLASALWEGHPFRLVTKTPGGNPSADQVRASVLESAGLLGSPVYGVLVHHVDAVLGDDRSIMDTLLGLQAEGLVSRVGVSVYSPGQLARVMDRYDVDLVQVPLNLFDQRFTRDGLLERLHDRGVEIHTRSAFLQGLLLMQPDDIPPSLDAARPALAKVRALAHMMDLTLVELCLGWVLGLEGVDRVVCGVNDLAQTEELLSVRPLELSCDIVDSLAVDDPSVVDPSQWKVSR